MINNKIDKIHIKKFKSIKDLKVNLVEGLNIIIGKNGAGKSNFLEFTNKLVNAVYNNNLNEEFGSIEFYLGDNLINLEFFQNIKFRFLDFTENITSNTIGDFKLKVNSNLIYRQSKDYTKSFINFNEKKIAVFNYPSSILNGLTSEKFNLSYRFIKYSIPNELNFISDNFIVKIKSYFFDTSYSSFLDDVILNFTINFDRNIIQKREVEKENIISKIIIPKYIITNIQKYTPIEDLRFNPNVNIYYKEDDCIIDNLKLEFKINNDWLPWSQLSDGTKRLFYIVGEISARNGLILLEEPELGVHPHQLNLLLDFLKEQSVNKQIIISTHSPQVLNILNSDELDHVFIANYSNEKGTQFSKLSVVKKKKANRYMKEVGALSDYWLMSDLED